MLKCEFCGSEFKTNSSLNQHKKIAKYCLKIRDKEILNNDVLTCKYCNNNFKSKKALVYHINICKEKNVNIIYELNESILELNERIKNLEDEINHINCFCFNLFKLCKPNTDFSNDWISA